MVLPVPGSGRLQLFRAGRYIEFLSISTRMQPLLASKVFLLRGEVMLALQNNE